MLRPLGHLLLCLALFAQGIGGVCASVPTLPMSTAMSMKSMPMATDPMAMKVSLAKAEPAPAGAPVAETRGDECPGCPSCPDKKAAGQDCLHSCSMPAGAPSLAVFLPPILAAAHLPSLPRNAAAEFIQSPPTPPPIA